MAKCVSCQEELPEGSIFCPNCGTHVEPAQPETQSYQPEPEPLQLQYQQPEYQQQSATHSKNIGLLVWSIIMIVMTALSCSIIPLILSIIACVKVNSVADATTDEEEARKNKTATILLIISVVLICIGFVLGLVLGGWIISIIESEFGGVFDEFFNQSENMYLMFRLH